MSDHGSWYNLVTTIEYMDACRKHIVGFRAILVGTEKRRVCERSTLVHVLLGFSKTALYDTGCVYIDTCLTILLGEVDTYNFKSLPLLYGTAYSEYALIWVSNPPFSRR